MNRIQSYLPPLSFIRHIILKSLKRKAHKLITCKADTVDASSVRCCNFSVVNSSQFSWKSVKGEVACYFVNFCDPERQVSTAGAQLWEFLNNWRPLFVPKAQMGDREHLVCSNIRNVKWHFQFDIGCREMIGRCNLIANFFLHKMIFISSIKILSSIAHYSQKDFKNWLNLLGYTWRKSYGVVDYEKWITQYTETSKLNLYFSSPSCEILTV